jgi:DNA replication licensing factor MCM4
VRVAPRPSACSAGGNSKGGIRGDINVLVVGDPSVSKSQLLGFVHHVAPRGECSSCVEDQGGSGMGACGCGASEACGAVDC